MSNLAFSDALCNLSFSTFSLNSGVISFSTSSLGASSLQVGGLLESIATSPHPHTYPHVLPQSFTYVPPQVVVVGVVQVVVTGAVPQVDP